MDELDYCMSLTKTRALVINKQTTAAHIQFSFFTPRKQHTPSLIKCSHLPRADAKSCHEGIFHSIHKHKRIGSPHHKENERENNERMDYQANHHCHNEQGQSAKFFSNILHTCNTLCNQTTDADWSIPANSNSD